MARHFHYRADTFTALTSIGYLISQIQAVLRAELEALFEREDISFSQWRVLMCLRDGMGGTCAEISRELSHDKGSMTRLVDQLEGRGLLKRNRDVADRRVVLLSLTSAGRAAVNRLVAKVAAYYNERLERFSPQEVKALVALLTKLQASVHEPRDGAAAHSEKGRAP